MIGPCQHLFGFRVLFVPFQLLLQTGEEAEDLQRLIQIAETVEQHHRVMLRAVRRAQEHLPRHQRRILPAQYFHEPRLRLREGRRVGVDIEPADAGGGLLGPDDHAELSPGQEALQLLFQHDNFFGLVDDFEIDDLVCLVDLPSR